MRILYVDDDHEDRQFFCEVIEEILPGSACEMASDGEDAIRKLKSMKVRPHYIFLDLGMPVMDGMSCLRAIKSSAKLKEIPVVIFSSSLNQDFHLDLKKLGADHVILKPSTYADWGKALSIVFKS
jgi:CheY-like chemotaxis protein